MEWPDLMLFVKNQMTEVNAQLFPLRVEKKRCSAAFGQFFLNVRTLRAFKLVI